MQSLILPYVMVYRAERYSTTNGPFHAASTSGSAPRSYSWLAAGAGLLLRMIVSVRGIILAIRWSRTSLADDS